MLDESGKWFDRYEKMIDDLDEQLTTYNTNRKIVLDNIINGVSYWGGGAVVPRFWSENRYLIRCGRATASVQKIYA